MAVTDLMTRPCTILQAGARADDYDQTPGTPVSVTTVCELQSALLGSSTGSESGEGAIQTSVLRVFLPPSTEVSGADALVVNGVRYEFSGDPWPVWNPRLEMVSHIEGIVERAA